MLSNIGTISFILYGVFILIAFAALIVLFLFLKKSTLGLKKIDKLIDFFKTVLYTTAFSAVGFIVANFFQERKQIIAELEFFDKYTDEIKQVNGQSRLQLAQYFSIVAPNSEIKQSWANYYDTLRRIQLEAVDAMIENLTDTTPNPTDEQKKRRIENRMRIEQYEHAFSMNETTEWWIVGGSSKTLDAAKKELDKVIPINANSFIVKRGNFYLTVLGGYSTKIEADNQLIEVKDNIYRKAMIVDKDTWCKDVEITDECLICK